MLAGGAGTNTANYGAAASTVNVNLRTGTASSDGEGGSDSLSGIQNVTAPALSGNVLQGDAGNNVLDSGGAGGATVSYSGAASGVNVDLGSGTATGDGNDILVGGFSTATGSAFADTLTAAPSGSTLNGLGGADTLMGGSSIDFLNGGAGDDSMTGGPGVGNMLDGATGTDTLDYSSATSVVSVNLAAGSAIVSYPAGLGVDLLSNFENVTGSPGDDTLLGDGGDNVLRGLGGNDFLQGQGGDDSIQGNAGTDTADFSDSAGGVNVNLATQSALGDGSDTLSSIENASGSNLADQLSGNGGPNTLQGLGGNDQIDGGGGSDVIDGGANDDSIYAKDGLVDTIACGGGNDSATVDAIDLVNADCEAAGFLGGPVVRTIEASGMTTTAATLNGGVNPDGRAVNYRFRYGPTSAYGTTTPSAPLPASHTESLVSAAISGLLRVRPTTSSWSSRTALGNETLGNDQTFTTGSVPHSGPVAMTLPANAGDPPHDATLLGSVTTNGVPTTYFFQWGLTVAYGQQTPAQLLGSTAMPVLVWDSIDAKPPSVPLKTTIHYRLVATNEFGTSFGNDKSFTTPLKGPAVILERRRHAAAEAERADRPAALQPPLERTRREGRLGRLSRQKCEVTPAGSSSASPAPAPAPRATSRRTRRRRVLGELRQPERVEGVAHHGELVRLGLADRLLREAGVRPVRDPEGWSVPTDLDPAPRAEVAGDVIDHPREIRFEWWYGIGIAMRVEVELARAERADHEVPPLRRSGARGAACGCAR